MNLLQLLMGLIRFANEKFRQLCVIYCHGITCFQLYSKGLYWHEHFKNGIAKASK